MTKQEILDLISAELDKRGPEFGLPLIRGNRKWRYPKTGDTQGTCPMLDTMFKIEYHSGLIIHIPDQPNQFGQPGNTNRNQEEG